MNDNRFEFKPRIIPLMIGIGILFVVYLVHLFSLQILRGFEYRNRATQVARRITPISAQRGEIFDRDADAPLVLNVDSFAVDIVPAELPSGREDEVIERLSDVLSIPESEIRAKLTPDKVRLYQPVEITGRIDAETIYYIAEHIEKLPGVTWHNKPIRRYMETGSIAHVLGYVNDITTEELQVLYNRGYKPGDVVGKRGVEKTYDQVLRGTDGVRYSTVDVTGRRIDTRDEDVIEPTNGKDLVLTLDADIQRLAEKALGDRVGSVVVLKPATGEILAMVSYPWYNPNDFYTDRGSDAFRELSLDPRAPLLNRAIQSSYAPASTFKIIMTTALLEEEAIDPEMTIECTGSIEVGDQVFPCWQEHGHGPVNLAQALAQSCNVYFFTVGLEYLGIERISDYMRRFGLGERTGIDLQDDKSGLAPTPGWKERTKGEVWVGGDTVNMSIGQGYTLVTPLQLANVVAMVANKGTVYQPHLLKEIRDPISGEVVEEITPRILRQSTIQKSVFEEVQRAMRGVITEGTAKVVITTDAVEIAGKTGTGEAGAEEQWNSWFVAFAPYDADPEDMVVVAVLVEWVNEWEWWAPKAANIIFQGIFADQSFEEAIEAMPEVRWFFQ